MLEFLQAVKQDSSNAKACTMRRCSGVRLGATSLATLFERRQAHDLLQAARARLRDGVDDSLVSAGGVALDHLRLEIGA
jgi:hypothetical protein